MFRRQPVFLPVPQRTETTFVTREVHEHRAPTDDSVKLLREMEQAARDQVDQTIRVEDSPIDCLMQINIDLANRERVARVHFKINGVQRVVETRVKDAADPLTFSQEIAADVAQKIAAEILHEPFVKALQDKAL